MRLTTRGRYAVTAMLDLAINATDGPVTLSDISQRQGISLSYLEQLFSRLRKNELVNSVRGPGGGYLLNRDGTAINIAQIVDAVNESVDATGCHGKGNCNRGEMCLTHHLWEDLSSQIHQFLSSISLATLLDRHRAEETLRRDDSRFGADGHTKVLDSSQLDSKSVLNLL